MRMPATSRCACRATAAWCASATCTCRTAIRSAPRSSPTSSPGCSASRRARASCSRYEEPFLLLGDYNVIPEPVDAKNPEAWAGDALYQPETRAAYRSLLNLGLTDAVRACLPGPGVYTFWDYQAGAWQKDHGIRIDHILASPQAADRIIAAGIDKHTRAWEKPSDHVPVWVETGFGLVSTHCR